MVYVEETPSSTTRSPRWYHLNPNIVHENINRLHRFLYGGERERAVVLAKQQKTSNTLIYSGDMTAWDTTIKLNHMKFCVGDKIRRQSYHEVKV